MTGANVGNTVTMSRYYRGKVIPVEVNQVIDVRDFVGTPGWAMLVAAANTHLSIDAIAEFIEDGGVGRSRSWVQRRRWMFQIPGTDNAKGPLADLDGKASRAFEIMRANPTMSARALSFFLKKHGIKRERTWVMENRCKSPY